MTAIRQNPADASRLIAGQANVSNPFATRFIRPQAMDFMFDDGLSAESLIQRLEAAAWNGQICGPHGSGKSTLVATLIPFCVRRGRRVVTYNLHDRQRRLPMAAVDRTTWDATTLVVVDGYEQLAWSWCYRLHWWCRQANSGLLLTTHQPIRWPVLYQTRTSPPLLHRLVRRLTATEHTTRPSDEQIRQAFDAHQGNLREALLQLYDVWHETSSAHFGTCR
jgi:hypothetical protein